MVRRELPVGWVAEAAQIIQADDPHVLIPFTGDGYRTVAIAFQTQGATDVYLHTADDTGVTAMVSLTGAEEPTVVTLAVEALPMNVYSSAPSNVLVQPFGNASGALEPFTL